MNDDARSPREHRRHQRPIQPHGRHQIQIDLPPPLGVIECGLRFSDLERAFDGISQKMLSQQLRQLEQDHIITRIVHAEVPPKVEYHLTEWGQSLCPALDRLLTWAEHQPSPSARPG